MLLFFLFFNSFVSDAQQNKVEFEKIRIEIEGEEVFDVHKITQDHEGYLWMATNLGLIRYNGLDAKKYDINRNDSSSMANDEIWVLYTDKLGELWIGTNSGLSKYNPGCDCFYQYPSNIEDVTLALIRSITEDNNNNIWIGTKNGDLLHYERESDNFSRILYKPSDPVQLTNDPIHHLLVDQHNNLWIGTSSVDAMSGSGLVRYTMNSGNVRQFLHDPSDPNSLSDNRISALFEDQQGQILIGTYKSGFHIYNAENDQLYRIDHDVNNPGQLHAPYTEENVFGNDPLVNLIHQDQIGGYWIGTTGGGINHFGAGTKTFNNYTFNLVNPQFLWSIYEDRQGNLWVGGGMGSGLFKTDLFKRHYHINTNFINVEAAYESPINPGILWIKSQETALSKMNLKTNEIKNYRHDKENSKSIGHNWVRSIYQENLRTLWVGLGNGGPYGGHDGNGGIGRMDIAAETFTHFKLTRNDDGLDDFSYTVYSICEDKEGYLWLGAGPGGIFRSNKEKSAFEHFKILEDDNRSGNVFLNIARIDSNGDLWASDFAGEGTIYLYDRQEDKFKPYLKGFRMYNLIVDDKGWLLIGTWHNGLIHLNPSDKTYVQYTKEDGLPSNEGVDIVQGKNGIFWVNTRIGPAKFDPQTGKITPAGLPKIRYNSGIFMASDNNVYVGSNNGLYAFSPDQVLGNPFPPQVNISELLISDKTYLTGINHSNDLSLSYNQNDIAFKYIALHFSNSAKNRYQYKLQPLNDEWIEAGFERTIRYANLPPGSYNFQVKASNSDGVWSEKTDTVQFAIHPAWWATWWAYAVYILILTFLAFRVYRFQLSRRIADSERQRLKEMNQLKNTLFTNITHEFRTPLTVIKGMADSIKSGIENRQLDDLQNSVEMIDRNSDGLLHLVNEMLDLAKIESGNMELHLVQADVLPFIKYISESFSSFAEENQINLTIYSEIDELVMDFDGDKLTAVISNLLSNAIKFTPEFGKIIVHIKRITRNEKSYLFLKVKDNGIGISREELPNIFNRFYQADASAIRKSGGTGIGLALTKELVDLMNGSIEAKSTMNEGSEFSILIPVTNNAPTSKDFRMGKVSHPSLSGKPPVFVEKNLDPNHELPLVLIIEDNKDVAHYLKTCLANKYEIIHAADGNEGIEMALEKIPDIIISDVMMPGKDGFEVCETLKSDERSDHIPIILLTAKVTMEDRLTGLSHGADAYLAKPFNKEELFTRLDQLVLLRKKLIDKIQNKGLKALFKQRTKNPKLQFLQKAEKLIHEDIGDSEFGSVELAKKLLVSDSQLYRKIKAITGKSTAVFIRSVRLQFAKELLSTSDNTVSEVAYEVGFNDPSWFSRAFKDEFGFSPSQTPR